MARASGAAALKVATPEELGITKVEDVPVDLLHVDHTYQRDLDMMRVQRYASHWDAIGAGTILVSRRRDGTMYVVNGQHRWAAAKMSGQTTMLAYVAERLDAAGEARLRLLTNDMKTDRPAERFRALLASGDERSIAIDQIVRAAGSEVNVGSPNAHAGINAISTLEFIFDSDGGVLLARTLDVVNDAYGRINTETAGTAFLKGIGFLLSRHQPPELDRAHLVDRLAKAGPAQLRRLAVNYQAVHGGAGWLNVYRAVTEVYNERLSDGRKLKWRLGGWTKTYGSSGGGGFNSNSRAALS